jgi:ABC-type sugar transport system permease subunit
MTEATVAWPIAKDMRQSWRRSNRSYRRFLFPAIIALVVLTLLPILFSIALSMTSLSYTSVSPARFVGIKNYVDLFSDERFLRSLWQSAILIFGPLPFQLVFGYLLAVAMNERLPGMGWLRVIFIIPMFFPPIVMGLMWKILFTPQLGGINYYLGLLGIDGPLWLAQPGYALISIMIVAIRAGRRSWSSCSTRRCRHSRRTSTRHPESTARRGCSRTVSSRCRCCVRRHWW